MSRSGRELRLDRRRDYRIVLTRPLSGVGGLSIVGGRNVALVGGHITVTAPRGASGDDRRALALRDQTGTVHVEGLLIDNAGGDLAEGIQIAAPAATVQLQNVRVEGVHARDETGFSDTHPDLVQVWGGVEQLRVHNFTGVTRYQGFFLKPDRNRIGRVLLSNVNVRGEGPARYLLWKRCRQGYPHPCEGPDFPVGVRNVWVDPAPGRELRLTLKPEPPADDWRAISEGVPPFGDFVPAAVLRRRYSR